MISVPVCDHSDGFVFAHHVDDRYEPIGRQGVLWHGIARPFKNWIIIIECRLISHRAVLDSSALSRYIFNKEKVGAILPNFYTRGRELSNQWVKHV